MEGWRFVKVVFICKCYGTILKTCLFFFDDFLSRLYLLPVLSTLPLDSCTKLVN